MEITTYEVIIQYRFLKLIAFYRRIWIIVDDRFSSVADAMFVMQLG